MQKDPKEGKHRQGREELKGDTHVTEDFMDTLQEIVSDKVGKDCAGIIVDYLIPLPKLPFLDELEVMTEKIAFLCDYAVDTCHHFNAKDHLSFRCKRAYGWVVCWHDDCPRRC